MTICPLAKVWNQDFTHIMSTCLVLYSVPEMVGDASTIHDTEWEREREIDNQTWKDRQIGVGIQMERKAG